MKVRLRVRVFGISRGIKLSQFAPGVIYDVSPEVGRELTLLGAEVISESSSVRQPEDLSLTEEQLMGGVTVIPRDTAGDRPRQRRRK